MSEDATANTSGAQVRAVCTPADSAAGGQQLRLERVVDHRLERPLHEAGDLARELDTELLADQVAAASAGLPRRLTPVNGSDLASTRASWDEMGS